MKPEDVPGFAKFLRLLGSENQGERAVAALKATKYLADRGEDWHSLVDDLKLIADVRAKQGGSRPTQAKAQSSGNSIDHRVAASQCLSLFNFWTEKESSFLVDMQYVNWPTQKQMNWLKTLYERYLREIRS